jgi:hypothetical protein
MRKILLSGQQIANWFVIGPAPSKKHETYWRCRCACGKEADICAKNLRYGKSRSCGCATKEMHGESHTVEYALFHSMRNRCNNPNSRDWHLYGGKGVKIEWETFAEFHRDLGDRPSPQHSIDRINGNGNYSKNNCRWATAREQARNMRTNRLITVDGITKCSAEWAESTGLSRECIEARIDKLKWSHYDAIRAPVQMRRKHRISILPCPDS